MNQLNALIETLSNASDNPGDFREAFERAVARRVHQHRAAQAEGRKPTLMGVVHSLNSLFQEFKNSRRSTELALQAKTFDVDQLRAFYNDHLIPLTVARVHVTILPDDDQVILHFINDVKVNGLEVAIYRLSDARQKGEAGPSVTRTIRGNDVRFALNQLGLTVSELDQVAFRLKIGEQSVEGRL